MSVRWELCTCSKKAKFFCTISVGMSCRIGSNTLLFTNQQEDQLLRLVLMIWSHDILKIIDFILFPLQILVYFTDYSLFYRLQFPILDNSFPLNAAQSKSMLVLNNTSTYAFAQQFSTEQYSTGKLYEHKSWFPSILSKGSNIITHYNIEYIIQLQYDIEFKTLISNK